MSALAAWWGVGAVWLIAALLLAIAELVAPGFFLIFLAVGAALTGFVVLGVPALAPIVQALLFAGFTAAAVAVGRRWYRTSPVATSDPLLNDRAARLIGSVVTVETSIVHGQGRVRVGDGAWSARGPDAPAGSAVRVVGVADGALRVEPA